MFIWEQISEEHLMSFYKYVSSWLLKIKCKVLLVIDLGSDQDSTWFIPESSVEKEEPV